MTTLFVVNDNSRFFFFSSPPTSDRVQGTTSEVFLDEEGKGPIYNLDMHNRLASFLEEQIPAGQVGRLVISDVEALSPK